jgi:hypothetical protein
MCTPQSVPCPRLPIDNYVTKPKGVSFAYQRFKDHADIWYF